MKKNKIITKTIKLLSFIPTVFVIYFLRVEAFSFPGGGQWGATQNGNAYEETKGCSLYRSLISIGYDILSTININVYDKEGNNIKNSDETIDLKNAIKAGTWVGINIEEKHEAHYSASVSSQEIKYKATCTYSCFRWIPCDNNGDGKRNESCYDPYTHTSSSSGLNKCDKDSFSCPGISNCSAVSFSTAPYTVSASAYQSSLQSRVEGALSAAAYSIVNQNIGNIEYIPVNDYDQYKTENLTVKASGVEATTKNGNKGYTQSYSYSPNKICMDLKTGNVTYKEIECNISENKIEIKNKIAKDGKEYWHYFAPLNMKRNQRFFIDIDGDKIFTTEQCINFINENVDNYFQFIEPNSNKITMPSTNSEKDRKKFIAALERIQGATKKIVEEAGCKLKTGINIPIIQRFYNEYENNETIGFKGFNFYYKPIDVNNPFPNSLTDTSIWYDWYNENKKQPDLTKSFNKKTYAVDVGNNGDVIRNYTTKDLPYTTWQNMKLNGTSSFIDFIETYGIGKRIDKQVNKTYKLGCSSINEKPTNEDGSKNYLYVDWCDNS